jgi:NAD(P)-dependent dehydrogenase (short-subunit alcohol dehydrogenase family)
VNSCFTLGYAAFCCRPKSSSGLSAPTPKSHRICRASPDQFSRRSRLCIQPVIPRRSIISHPQLSGLAGVIVNTSSGNGLGGCPQASFYSATKAGIIALSKSAAWEYAKEGVRVNAFVAGAFRTPLLEGSMDRAAGGDPEARKAVEDRWMTMTAAGRIGDPAEAAEAVLWLCSDASSYVVGHSLIVDGGLTSLWR